MASYFSEKMKQLRKARDLTQEQVADIFLVAPQTVSRWETGTNYPDIDMLPHIAIFFKVSVDELLGTEDIRGEEKAAAYRRDIRNLLNEGKLGDALDLARTAVREYPVNPDLLYLLLQALCTACSDASPESLEDKDKYKKEIIAIGERIASSAEQHAYFPHKYQLVRQYAKWGMQDEAKKIVYSLPAEAYHTQDLTLQYVLEGEDWLRTQKNSITRFTIMLCAFIEGYARKADLNPLQKIACLNAMTQIEDLTFPLDDLEDDNGTHIGKALRNAEIAALYCEAGDTERALLSVEHATKEAMHVLDEMDQTNEDGSNYYAWPTPRNLCWILWEDHFATSQFDCIRSEDRFVRCFEALKANSRQLK